MKKYMKFGLIAIVALAALSVGLTAVSFADSPDDVANSDGGPRQIFISKVAAILELDEEQVADAFIQARQEMREEFQQQRLQTAIDEGLITEAEAEQIQWWWDICPKAMQQLGPLGGFHMRNTWCHQMNLR